MNLIFLGEYTLFCKKSRCVNHNHSGVTTGFVWAQFFFTLLLSLFTGPGVICGDMCSSGDKNSDGE